MAARSDHPRLYTDLTPREMQVLNFIAEGKTTVEIAKSLGIAVKTAACHRSRLLGKFDARNTVVMVRHAIRIGLIDA